MSRDLQLRMDVSGPTVTVRVAGELDLSTACELRACLEMALAHRTGPVVVDVRELVFLDSHGVDAVLDAARSAGRARAVRVEGATPFVRRVLTLTDADLVIDLAES